MYWLLTLVLILLPFFATAGSLTKGENCSIAHNRLLVGTNQFSSDCDSHTFCSSAGICELRGCRKDQYPLGYTEDDTLPPKCPTGQFCPDEGDACQPYLTVDSPCQLNRDDQCEPPPNAADLRDTSYFGRNVDGAVCLNNVCMWANVTVGQSCIVENTAYIAYTGNDEYIDVVSRGNCMVGLYCDSQQLVCLKMSEVGGPCDGDKECISFNCQSDGLCGPRADMPNEVKIWVYAAVGGSIFGGMLVTLVLLSLVHRRQREEARERRQHYWHEQNALRRNLIQMQEMTRTSMFSGQDNRHPSMVYSTNGSSLPVLQNQLYGSSGLQLRPG